MLVDDESRHICRTCAANIPECVACRTPTRSTLITDPAYQQQAYLFGERAGIWEAGIWYSNTSYLQPPRVPTASRYLCKDCWTVRARSASRYCQECGWCFACGLAFASCICLPRRRSDPTSTASALGAVRVETAPPQSC